MKGCNAYVVPKMVNFWAIYEKVVDIFKFCSITQSVYGVRQTLILCSNLAVGKRLRVISIRSA